jgi:hypothetical protein
VLGKLETKVPGTSELRPPPIATAPGSHDVVAFVPAGSNVVGPADDFT